MITHRNEATHTMYPRKYLRTASHDPFHMVTSHWVSGPPEQQQQLRNSWVIKISLQHCRPRDMIQFLILGFFVCVFFFQNINLKLSFPALRGRASSVLRDFHWFSAPFNRLPPFKGKELHSQIFCEKPKNNDLCLDSAANYSDEASVFSYAYNNISQVACEN